jgi:hypothetical protein
VVADECFERERDDWERGRRGSHPSGPGFSGGLFRFHVARETGTTALAVDPGLAAVLDPVAAGRCWHYGNGAALPDRFPSRIHPRISRSGLEARTAHGDLYQLAERTAPIGARRSRRVHTARHTSLNSSQIPSQHGVDVEAQPGPFVMQQRQLPGTRTWSSGHGARHKCPQRSCPDGQRHVPSVQTLGKHWALNSQDASNARPVQVPPEHCPQQLKHGPELQFPMTLQQLPQLPGMRAHP